MHRTATMRHAFGTAARLSIATALTGTSLTAFVALAAAPSATAATMQVRSDSRINIAAVSVRSLALTLSPRPGTAVLTWAAPRARAKFTIMATPVRRPTAARMLKATTGPVVSFAGLDENARYTFTVTPQIGRFTGPTSRLLMTATLKQLRSISVADQLKAVTTSTTSSGSSAILTSTSASTGTSTTSGMTNGSQGTSTSPASSFQTTAAPAAASAPAAPAPPRTRTVYVCPDGFTDVSGTCTTTLPYTFSSLAYTYHQEPYTVTVQDPPIVYAADTARSQGTLCPWGGSPNGGGDLCVIAGGSHTETRYNTVKDTAPSGYSDTGTEWQKKDAAPAGFTDDGTQWVKTTAKIATEVPA